MYLRALWCLKYNNQVIDELQRDLVNGQLKKFKKDYEDIGYVALLKF